VERVIELLPIGQKIDIAVGPAAAVERTEIRILAIKLLQRVVIAVDGQVVAPPAGLRQLVSLLDDHGETGGQEALDHLQIAAATREGLKAGNLLIDIIGDLPGTDVAIFGIWLEIGGYILLGNA